MTILTVILIGVFLLNGALANYLCNAPRQFPRYKSILERTGLFFAYLSPFVFLVLLILIFGKRKSHENCSCSYCVDRRSNNICYSNQSNQNLDQIDPRSRIVYLLG